MTKIINEREGITIDTIEILRITRAYEQLYAKELDNLEEMNKYLQTHDLPRLNQEQKI